MQSRASSPPSPMSSRITILLFWYVVPLSENQTSLAPGKEERYKLNNHYILFVALETFSLSEVESIQSSRGTTVYKYVLSTYLVKEWW